MLLLVPVLFVLIDKKIFHLLYLFSLGLLDHVTVLIGLAVNGIAVGGVVHQPFYNYEVCNNL